MDQHARHADLAREMIAATPYAARIQFHSARAREFLVVGPEREPRVVVDKVVGLADSLHESPADGSGAGVVVRGNGLASHSGSSPPPIQTDIDRR